MLFTLLDWGYAAGLSLVFGWMGARLLARLFGLERQTPPGLVFTAFLGWCALLNLTGLLSLVIPLGLAANLVLAGSALVILWRWRHAMVMDLRAWLARLRRLHPLTWILYLSLGLLVLLRATEIPLNYDTGLYHAQAIRWIESYAVVPGLGNLAERLAYNSSWFLLPAFFGGSFLGLHLYQAAGSFLFLLTGALAAGGIDDLLHGHFTFTGAAGLVTIFLMRRVFIGELSSPGTDMPAALLVWAVFLLSLDRIEQGKDRQSGLDLIGISVLSITAVTVKLSAFPVMLLPAYFIARLPRLRMVVRHLALAGLVALPWVGRSIILSGYLVYPFPQIDLFHPDWKIPSAYARAGLEAIRAWALWPRRPASEVLGLSLAQWLPAWWARQASSDRQLILALAAATLLLPLAGMARVAWSRRAWRASLPYLPLVLAGGLGIAYWFVQAPDIRFGYVFIGALFIIEAAPLFRFLIPEGRLGRWVVIVAALALCVYMGASLYRLRDFSKIRQRLLTPEPYPVVELVDRTLGEFQTWMPANGDQCWYAPLPCTPTHNPQVHRRGASLQDGFVTILKP